METSVTKQGVPAGTDRCLRFEFVLRSSLEIRKTAYQTDFKILTVSRLRIYARLCLTETEVVIFREAGAKSRERFSASGVVVVVPRNPEAVLLRSVACSPRQFLAD